MTDTTAKIRAKGLDATGITETVAAQMYGRKGARYMAIVELQVDELHEKADGTRKVDLILTQVEPAVDAHLTEHLRELTRTCYFNRKVDTDGPSLPVDGDDADEPTVDAVIAAGAKHKPHGYLASGLAVDDDAICDVCGLAPAAGVHSAQQLLDDEDDDGQDELPEPEDHLEDTADPTDRLADDDPDPDDDEDDEDDDEPVPAANVHHLNPFAPSGTA
ncbi:hypothetical protein [Nocardioides bruguierae]|uniref:hypothetical protein n=1 Tax=Nocardioides bruguierae TaxID=2945102 RepID=UPI002020015A|nr:hypothetical protein [Nocardioides bruguierae]MCL8026336.1 hypothetical protein [Nocardioides bruguierae]